MVPLQDISTLSTLFYRFITLLRLKFAFQPMGTSGFPRTWIFFQNIRRGEHSLFLTFLAPTKAPIPTHCVFIASLRPVLRRFRYILVRDPAVASSAIFHQNKERGFSPVTGRFARFLLCISASSAAFPPEEKFRILLQEPFLPQVATWAGFASFLCHFRGRDPASFGQESCLPVSFSHSVFLRTYR